MSKVQLYGTTGRNLRSLDQPALPGTEKEAAPKLWADVLDEEPAEEGHSGAEQVLPFVRISFRVWVTFL